jgi:hypothetical protein
MIFLITQIATMELASMAVQSMPKERPQAFFKTQKAKSYSAPKGIHITRTTHK